MSSFLTTEVPTEVCTFADTLISRGEVRRCRDSEDSEATGSVFGEAQLTVSADGFTTMVGVASFCVFVGGSLFCG